VDFYIGLCSSRLKVERSKIGRFGSSRIDLSKLLRGSTVLLRAANPDVVGKLNAGTEEVVASIDAEDCAEAVLKVVLRTISRYF
jgi:hypothetical protein